VVRKGPAKIRSPEIIKRFRHRFVEFDAEAHLALDTVMGDVSSVAAWLEGEQLRYWRQQQRRRHDMMKEAWRDYVNARYSDRRTGKASCLDERKAYERAKRLKEEAEEKIVKVQGWMAALEREAKRLRPPCLRFEAMLTNLTPRALARLDHMLDNLEEYLRPSSPKGE
jgi:hypothetical protein